MAEGSRNRRPRVVGLLVYSIVAAVDVVLAGAGRRRLRWLTKPALMPLLAAAEGRSADPLVVAGIGFSWLGDIALLYEGEGPFATGLAAFLAAHLSYIAALSRRRSGGIRQAPALAASYALAWLGLNVLLWSRSGRLRWPVAIYGSTLLIMALAALDTGDPRATAGGAAFMASDGLLALDVFGVAELPAADSLVMATYTAAQALLALGARRD
ncbi:MAG TPA: lysoplasmalogenase [Acidimicrobiales bacterium]|nr:lysoplasmalogenase [Acidimicrobiales bacterium]